MDDVMERHLQSRVLAVGNAAHSDFDETREILRRETEFYSVPNGEFAASWLSANPPFDWVILFQSRPSELPRDIVERLSPLAGSAQFVSLLGSWCEGELRTGRPWPTVPRIYWHAFPSWWRTKTGGNTISRRGHVAVSAGDFSTAETLIDALAIEGWSATWWPRHAALPLSSGVSVGIWVGGQLNGLEAVQLDAFCRRMREEQAPVFALLDFPRRDRVDLARRIGALTVLGKPWHIVELSTMLQDRIDPQSATTDRRLAIQYA